MDILLGLAAYLVDHAAVFVGFILPPIVEILNKDVYNEGERFFVTIFTCAAAAILIHWKEFMYGTPDQIIVSATIFFTECELLFKLYWRDSWLRWATQQKFNITHTTWEVTPEETTKKTE